MKQQHSIPLDDIIQTLCDFSSPVQISAAIDDLVRKYDYFLRHMPSPGRRGIFSRFLEQQRTLELSREARWMFDESTPECTSLWGLGEKFESIGIPVVSIGEDDFDRSLGLQILSFFRRHSVELRWNDTQDLQSDSQPLTEEWISSVSAHGEKLAVFSLDHPVFLRMRRTVLSCSGEYCEQEYVSLYPQGFVLLFLDDKSSVKSEVQGHILRIKQAEIRFQKPLPPSGLAFFKQPSFEMALSRQHVSFTQLLDRSTIRSCHSNV